MLRLLAYEEVPEGSTCCRPESSPSRDEISDITSSSVQDDPGGASCNANESTVSFIPERGNRTVEMGT